MSRFLMGYVIAGLLGFGAGGLVGYHFEKAWAWLSAVGFGGFVAAQAWFTSNASQVCTSGGGDYFGCLDGAHKMFGALVIGAVLGAVVGAIVEDVSRPSQT